MYSKEELSEFSYRQLQKLCKQVNLKANKKNSQLVEELSLFFENLKKDEQRLVGELGMSQEDKHDDGDTNNDQIINDIEASKEVEEEKSIENLNGTFTIEEEVEGNNDLTNEEKSNTIPPSENAERVSEERNIESKEIINQTDPVETEKQLEYEEYKKGVEKEIEERAKQKISMIPRIKDLPKKKIEPITPGRFAKQHQKQFNKMDSIDVYVGKSRKRAAKMESVGVSSTKKAKVTNTRVSIATTSSVKKSVPRPSLMSRKSVGRKSVGRKSVGCEKLRFNLTQPESSFHINSFKSPTKTPKKTPAKFDLQASLKKGLSYKPYTGKLKNQYYTGDSPAPKRQQNTTVLKEKNVKLHKEKIPLKENTKKKTTIADRRNKAVENRNNKRNAALAKRRGIET